MVDSPTKRWLVMHCQFHLTQIQSPIRHERVTDFLAYRPEQRKVMAPEVSEAFEVHVFDDCLEVQRVEILLVPFVVCSDNELLPFIVVRLVLSFA